MLQNCDWQMSLAAPNSSKTDIHGHYLYVVLPSSMMWAFSSKQKPRTVFSGSPCHHVTLNQSSHFPVSLELALVYHAASTIYCRELSSLPPSPTALSCSSLTLMPSTLFPPTSLQEAENLPSWLSDRVGPSFIIDFFPQYANKGFKENLPKLLFLYGSHSLLP